MNIDVQDYAAEVGFDVVQKHIPDVKYCGTFTTEEAAWDWAKRQSNRSNLVVRKTTKEWIMKEPTT